MPLRHLGHTSPWRTRAMRPRYQRNLGRCWVRTGARMAGMVEVPPLPTMLSQALVAFTIEFDNEFEQRMPHRTSRHGATAAGGPWLVSLAMWVNCMRFCLRKDGRRRVTGLARADTSTDSMRRWGYVTIDSASVLRPPHCERQELAAIGGVNGSGRGRGRATAGGACPPLIASSVPACRSWVYGLFSIDRGPKVGRRDPERHGVVVRAFGAAVPGAAGLRDRLRA